MFLMEVLIRLNTILKEQNLLGTVSIKSFMVWDPLHLELAQMICREQKPDRLILENYFQISN